MQIILKSAIAQDPHFTTESKNYGGPVEYKDHAFMGHRLQPNRDGNYVMHVELVGFYDVPSLAPQLADYVIGVEMHEEFNCLSVRHQGHYKLEGGRAEGYLQRNYLKIDDYGPADKEEDFPLDGDPEIVRVARLQYELKIRAALPQDALCLYRAIRAGKIRPIEDWDAPMVDKS